MKFVRDNTIELADATATTNGPAIDANQLISMSVQAIKAADAEGTVKLQASNDEGPPSGAGAPPSNWTDIASATVTLTASPGTFLIPKTDLCYRWVRVVYTRTGGGGALTVKTMALSL
jgi:hypothetical protein